MFMTVLKADVNTMSEMTKPVDLSDGYAVHQWVTRLFSCKREDGDLLHRVERNRNEIFVYIYSNNKIHDRDIKRYGFIILKEWEITEDKANGKIAFKILASFDKREKETHKRRMIQDKAGRIEWLKKKLSPFISDIQIKELGTGQQFVNIPRDHGSASKIPYAECSGMGIVTDPKGFIDFISKGIGTNKSWGLGMFLFKPI